MSNCGKLNLVRISFRKAHSVYMLCEVLPFKLNVKIQKSGLLVSLKLCDKNVLWHESEKGS